jgi:hypothetical protein
MDATPPDAEAAEPMHTPTLPGVLRGALLDRVRATWAAARAAGDAHHEPFLVAVGALAVYARACSVPVEEVVRTLYAMTAAERPARARRDDAEWRAVVRHTVRRNYFSRD